MMNRSLQKIRKEIAQNDWAAKLYAQQKQTAQQWMHSFSDSVEYVSGWGHNFFCDKCSQALIFDPFHPVKTFVCPHCGYENTDQKFEEAYHYQYRVSVAEAMSACALAYQIEPAGEKEQYLQFIRSTLTFYAQNYDGWALHGQWAGKGKLMGQCLDEAVWMAQVLSLLQMVWEDLDRDFLDMLDQKLFLPMCRVLQPQVTTIHNIHLWMVAAMAMRALLYGDEAELDRQLYGSLGVLEQLEKGATADHFWYEQSVHYHFYAITGAQKLLLMMKAMGREDEQIFTKVQSMYEAPLQLLFTNLRFPNPNDGWPDRFAASYAADLLRANNLFDSPLISGVVSAVTADPAYTPSLNDLLYGGKAPSARLAAQSVLMPATYFVYLKNEDSAVFCKYGFVSPSHLHRDDMNLEIEDFAFDLSNSGYGNPFSQHWYRRTCAHNTVAVDGKDHPFGGQEDIFAFRENKEQGKRRTSLPGEMCSFTPTAFTARTPQVYEGVDFTRSISLSGNRICDTFTCESEQSHTYDWCFHSEGECSFTPAGAAQLGFAENGYEYLTDVQALAPGSTVTWKKDGKALTLTPDGDAQAFVFHCPGNPAFLTLTGVLLRKKGGNAVFENTFTVTKSK